MRSGTQARETVLAPNTLRYSDVVTGEAVYYVSIGPFGWGLFAARPIRAGTLILRFHGETIDFASALTLGDDQCYCLQIDFDAYLNLDSPGRFVNHSCSPNAGIVNDDHLITIRDIHRDQEIYYDYSATMDENFWTMPCRCGTRVCRGTVKDFRHLPEFVRKRYLRLGIVQQFIAKQHAVSCGPGIRAI